MLSFAACRQGNGSKEALQGSWKLVALVTAFEERRETTRGLSIQRQSSQIMFLQYGSQVHEADLSILILKAFAY